LHLQGGATEENMAWKQFVGSLNFQVFFVKEP